jgi:UDP-GlcNAc:undecaprenyl-phosphate GlcNAc-1-phosphate transferase
MNLIFLLIVFFILHKIINTNKNFLYKKYFLDHPNLKRKLHKSPTYLIGGHFIFIILLTEYFIDYYNGLTLATNFTIFCSYVFFIGIIDDIKDTKAEIKLFFILIGYIFLVFLDDNYLLSKIYIQELDQTVHFGNFSLLISVLCVLLLINAFNLIDGINGLAMMIFILWSFTLHLYLDYNIEFFSLILYFLIFYNIYKGKYFLGNSGSLIVGSIIALQSIELYNQNINSFYPSENLIILFLLPGIDMFRLFIQRILKKQNPFNGDNLHLHHIMIKNMKLETVLLVYFLIISVSSYCAFNEIFSKYILLFSVTFLYFFLLIYFKKKNN